jgi:predicted nucleic acid-binding protein
MIVIDSSALINVLVYPRPSRQLRRRLDGDESLVAPHLLDLEMLSVLRGLTLAGEISEDRAGVVRDDFAEVPVERFPHAGLADRVWALRHNLTAYDAAYVALAEILDCPLVTSDSRMARASGHRAKLELYELS